MGTRSRRFLLGCVLIISGSQLVLVDGPGSAWAGESAHETPSAQSADMDHHDHAEGTVDMMIPHQQHRGPHMKWTALRPTNAGDAQRADRIVQVLRQALAKYRDYQMAMNDGFVPLHPERKPKHYHFANKERRFLAKIRFDPAEPTALLYKKTGDGYELEGAMYTAPQGMNEDQLNDRVPLSVAQWHAHVNLCVAADGSGRLHEPEAVRVQGADRDGIRVPASRRAIRSATWRLDASCLSLRNDTRKDLDTLSRSDGICSSAGPNPRVAKLVQERD